MSPRLDELDQTILKLLDEARSNPAGRDLVQNRLWQELLGVVVALVRNDLRKHCAGASEDARQDEASTCGIHALGQALEHLERVDWRLGDGFGVVNPKKVKEPSHLRRCVTTAAAREARKRCNRPIAQSQTDVEELETAAHASPHGVLEGKETRDRFFVIFATLRAPLREAYAYHRLLEWPLRPVAKILGTNHKQILARVEEADRIIRRQLGAPE